MPSATPPNINNYYIGKGVCFFKGPLDADYVDLGNAPKFEFDPKNTVLPHYSSRLGTRFKDDTHITAKEPEMALTLDEITQDNLALVLLGSKSGTTVNIMAEGSIRGAFKFVGSNDVGPKKQIILPLVVLIPTGKIGFIQDGYGQLELMGLVLGDPTTGSFGTIDDI